ncbi:hypothetical protein CEUSTIGMA_g867.t1 [Chlamydomonas eustigma]|uniref:AB hydrolase-1 domain-containing protein n=1 Tax=Chlamydomonas eustigma TaxID=1157962 RepID=A0A250WRE7_9CHLO|nr:hypothetical protein CEUSTIGMA_g867.t1 [Chlamydomonas eustigma]|eukprot:GAX73415.1 hypothetical protein CEUSTIGMA_g867.t1 [Chlamydomonas eustigma]
MLHMLKMLHLLLLTTIFSLIRLSVCQSSILGPWEPCIPGNAALEINGTGSTAAGERGLVCAHFYVLLDPSDVPEDPHALRSPYIKLFVAKRLADSNMDDSGNTSFPFIFMNFGGPGGDCVDSLVKGAYKNLPASVLDSYDIITFDPRGVGSYVTGSLTCGFKEGFEYMDFVRSLFPSDQRARADYAATRYMTGDAFPSNKTQTEDYWKVWNAVLKQCQKTQGQLMQHMSTADVARDMEELRKQVGQERLNYYGLSYGTLLGATYANIFPNSTGLMVLDGNTDPVPWFNNTGLALAPRLGSDLATAQAFDHFLRLCGGDDYLPTSCIFNGGSYDQTRMKWNQIWTSMEKRGSLYAPLGRFLMNATYYETYDAAQLVSKILGSLRLNPEYENLAVLLQGIWLHLEDPEDSAKLTLPISSRDPTVPLNNVFSNLRYLAVICGESPMSHSKKAYLKQALEETPRSGLFSYPYSAQAYSPCAVWPVQSKFTYTGPWSKDTSNPLLVIGNTYDPSTPYTDSVAMAIDRLARARLLTIKEGTGHLLFGNSSPCAWDVVVAYFANGTVPAFGTSCSLDFVPFRPVIS